MKSRHWIAAAALALVLAAPAYADLDTAKEMLDQGNAEGAVEELEALAYGGDAEAMVLLGDLYFDGTGVAANFSLAWSWYNRATRQGNAEAQYKLGRMMAEGQGAPRNELEALMLFEQAAEGGHPQAQLEAGLIYRDGTRQVRQSPTKAIEYLTAAAEQGVAEAELALEELNAPVPERRAEVEVQQSEATPAEPAAAPAEDLDEAGRIRAGILTWFDAIDTSMEGQLVGPPPEVVVNEVDGVFQVHIPDLTMSTATGESVRMGTVNMALTPLDAAAGGAGQDLDQVMASRRYQVAMNPPTRIEFVSGADVTVLSYDASEITGVWLPALYNFIEMNVELSNMAVVDPMGQTVATAERLSWVADITETEPGIWGGPYGMEVSNVLVTPPDGGRVTLGRISSETVLNGVQVESYGRMIEQLNTDPEGFLAALMDPSEGQAVITEMLELVTSSAFDFTIEDLAYVDEFDTQQFALGRLVFGGKASQEGSDNAAMEITYEHAGLVAPLEGPEASLLPTSTQLTVAVERIPLESLARSVLEIMGTAMVEAARADPNAPMADDDMAAMELQFQLMNVLSMAQTGMNVGLAVGSEVSDVALDGGVQASQDAMFGMVGNFDLTVTELEALLATMQQAPEMALYGAMVMAFAQTAESETGADGTNVSRFAISIEPDGNLLVNGQNAMAIAAGGMAPEEQAEPDQAN